ncbi:MAG: hypothetical protein KIS96_03730 [Bauldia sp.]|nr:hypothetical protein [Bauldia sp.]
MSDIPIVSDHALVRFIERIKGVSLDQYRDEILGLLREGRPNPIPDHGHDDGILFVIENESAPPVVVTVLSPGMRPRRPGAKRRLWFTTRTLVHIPTTEKGLTATPAARSANPEER